MVTDHPACAHSGGSLLVRAVPAHPPVLEVILGGAGIEGFAGALQAATSSNTSTQTAHRNRGLMAGVRPTGLMRSPKRTLMLP